MLQHTASRHARSSSLNKDDPLAIDDDKENKGAKECGKAVRLAPGTKRDFFGRIVNEVRPTSGGKSTDGDKRETASEIEQQRVWVSFNEGYSNAVRKPITLKELIESFEIP